jgi:hypothetical protein
MSEGPTAEGPDNQGPSPNERTPEPPPAPLPNRDAAGRVPGFLSSAAAAASILVFFAPAIWGLALPLSSIAMVLGMFGLLANPKKKSVLLLSVMGLGIGVVMSVIVAVHIILLPARRP